MSIGDAIMGAMNGGSMPSQIANAFSPPPVGGAPGQGAQPMAQAQATQSPPDLVQLYAKLMNQSRAASGFDRDLALFAGGFKGPPGGAQTIMNSVQPAQDSGAMLQNLMQLQQMQRMQQMAGQIGAPPAPGAAPGGPVADPLGGMDRRVFMALPPQQQAQVLSDAAKAGLDIRTKDTEAQQTDLREARDKSPAMNQQLTQMDTIANQVRTATNADGSPALAGIMSNPAKRVAAEKLMTTDPKEEPYPFMEQLYSYEFTPQERAVIQQMKQLDNQVYGEAFQSTGSRRTAQEVQNLRTGLSPLRNVNQPFSDYMKQFDQFQGQLHKSIGNNLGAAGELDAIPEQYRFGPDGKPLVDQSYLPGGAHYSGSGGDWVNHPPQQQQQQQQQGGPAPATIQSPGDIAKLAKGTPFVIPDGPSKGKIGYAQ